MKKSIIICVFLLIISSMAVFGEGKVDFELDDISSVVIGEELSGTIVLKQDGKALPYFDVTYKLTNKDGTKLYNIGQLRTDKNGHANYRIDYPEYVTAGGIHLEFTAANGGYIISTYMIESPFSVHFKNDIEYFGSDVAFSGYLSTNAESITFKVEDINNKEIKAFDVPVVDSEYNHTFSMPDVTGTYALVASIDGTHYYHYFIYTDNIAAIMHPDSIETAYGTMPNLQEIIPVLLSDGSTVNKPVTWDLSTVNLNQPGFYVADGRVEGDYYTFAFVTVKPYVRPAKKPKDKTDKEDSKEDSTVSEIDDLIPQAGSKATDEQKSEIRIQADTLINDLKKSSPKSSDIKSLNKSLNKALAILNKKETVSLVTDMVDLVNDSIGNFSSSEATELVSDLIKESYSNVLINPELTEKEKNAIEKKMLKAVKTLMAEKASVQPKDGALDLNLVNQAIENVSALQNALGDTELSIRPQMTIDLSSQQSLELTTDVINRLAESKMDVTLNADGVQFNLPAELVSKLGDVAIKSKESTVAAKKTANGKVKTLKTMELTVASNGKSVDGGVILTMPLDGLDVDLDTLMVGVLEGDNWVKLDYKIEDNTIIFTAPHFSTYSLMSYTPSFMDIENNWAGSYITSLAAKGLVSGKSEVSFDPNGVLTRAEFVTMLINHLDIENQTTTNFDDASGWYSDYLSVAKGNDLTYGSTNTLFRPMDSITREEMAMMIQKAYNIKNGHDLEGKAMPFSDHSDISQEASDAVYAMKVNGIISGYPDNTFKPQHTATRAEAATILYKLIEQ